MEKHGRRGYVTDTQILDANKASNVIAFPSRKAEVVMPLAA